jgi:hypothetical protein
LRLGRINTEIEIDKLRIQTDVAREWQLSAIGRRLLREGRQFATVRRIVVAAQKVFAERGLLKFMRFCSGQDNRKSRLRATHTEWFAHPAG